MSTEQSKNTDSRKTAQKMRVVIVKLSPELQRKRENPNFAEIAARTNAALKTGKQVPESAPKTDFEQRAEQTTAILKRVGVRR